jgi:hypothetical protein
MDLSMSEVPSRSISLTLKGRGLGLVNIAPDEIDFGLVAIQK